MNQNSRQNATTDVKKDFYKPHDQFKFWNKLKK